MSDSPRSVMWFRRDLRMADNPALVEAVKAGKGGTLGVFILDEKLLSRAGNPRMAFLVDCLEHLIADWQKAGGTFVVRRGDPLELLPELAKRAGASTIHATGELTPFGRRRDERFADALPDDIEFVRTGSPYAVTPGHIRKDDGTPYRVYTPFYRAWTDHGWPEPAHGVRTVPELPTRIRSDGLPKIDARDVELPEGGERAAAQRWKEFQKDDLKAYASDRDRPDLDATSRMSPFLHLGCIHPRTLLADLAGHSGSGPTTYRKELAWREFYADVLWHVPASAHEYYVPKFAKMTYDTGKEADERLRAWQDGQTGYPIVDAGMRQLLAEGWMHNRVRMIVASFLVKDLHLEWTQGARHFLDHLVDGDVASNQHGWQWVAGCGTDAAPYFRIFNPTTQGEKFDPTGDYVRRYVPELRDVSGKAVHQPWQLDGGAPNGYPDPIVDHAEERRESLNRYEAIR